MSNFNIDSTIITPKVRVSTAAIHYSDRGYGSRYQIETFIFSDDPGQKTIQRIHGDIFGEFNPDYPIIAYSMTFHRRVSRLLNKKYNETH